MSSEIQNAVLTSCRQFMRPIIRLLIRNGIGYREFSEICKALFVDVARSEYGLRGRKTNMSRVSVMTGISRKEVRKIRDTPDLDMLASVSRVRRPELILSIWHNDPDYSDSKLCPKRIRFDGPGPTFRDLVARVGGDIPPKAMLNELIRAGSVIEEGEKLRVVSRSYIPEPNDPEAVLVAGDAIKDLVSTIYHNLGSGDSEARFFERRVYSEKLSGDQRLRFRKLARERGELLFRDLNSWLGERESSRESIQSHGNDDQPAKRIGVGLYFFDESLDR
jgi:hypothetical protein